MIISVASCVLTIVSIQSAEYYAEISANIRSDPMRLAAQIISGVGFLGAGVILHRHDDAISGLTTAAIVWASAGVGITSGAGFYLHALLATGLFLLAIKLSYCVKGKIEVNLKMVVRKKMTLPELYSSLSSLEHVCAIALEH